jgi:hypothetical protein
VALGRRLHARAGRACGRQQEDHRRGGRPAAPGRRRDRARAGGHRAGAQARRRKAERLRRRWARGLALQHRLALPRERPALRRAAARAVQLQQRVWRLRDLPRLWPRDRRGHGPGHPRWAQDPAQWRHQTAADTGLEGLPGRPAEVRGRGRHPARHALVATDGSTARLGSGRHAALEGQLEQAVVRRAPLLRVPGEQGLQDAHPRALVQVPQLHALRGLRRRAAEAGVAAVAHGGWPAR